MIVLMSREQAESILGQSPTHPGSALEPYPLKTGEYVLPPDVLADPANADIYDLLLHLPQRAPILPEEQFDFGTPAKPNQPDIDAYEAARLHWPDGVIRQQAYRTRGASPMAKSGNNRKTTRRSR